MYSAAGDEERNRATPVWNRVALPIAVAVAFAANACGAIAQPSPSTSALGYGFAGVSAEGISAEVTSVRGTITWTVAPRTSPTRGITSWIAFAAPTGAGPVSDQIVQIGWLSTGPNKYRLFWEWDNTTSDHHYETGFDLQLGVPLRLQIVRESPRTYTLYANDSLLASVKVL